MLELSQIRSPEDIRGLSYEECETLADDIRMKIIQTVSRNGGHLSSNLGAVELTIALHRVFHCPEDKIIFDVGHQSYTHKLLTGRYGRFDTLRTYQGLCGFPRREESEYDVFETGHASTAISAAAGFARARDLSGGKNYVIAVVGDGAMTGGMCYEALDDCGSTKTRMIVILNENEMSIARNVGALSKHLSRMRASKSWNRTKAHVRNGLNRIPLIGPALYRFVHWTKSLVKRIFVDEGFFGALGFHYLGPIDGHDLLTLEKILTQAKDYDGPVLIHCVTKKGYGYVKAENLPEEFHGTPPFFVESGEAVSSGKPSNGWVANEKLIALAQKDPRICAVTAAMSLGTCTEMFKEQFPQRFFDTGIAEEHAVTMCSGMASGGMVPFFFVYSTFLQRGYDQVLHDVCLQKQHVIFMIDRAGIADGDGQTHHGLFDLTYLRHIPGMTVFSPCCRAELEQMIGAALEMDGPAAIRYPKAFPAEEPECPPFRLGKWSVLRDGGDAVILACGSMVSEAVQIAEAISEYRVGVINASTVKPLDAETLDQLRDRKIPVFTLEENAAAGGFGGSVLEYYAAADAPSPAVMVFGAPDFFIQHGDRARLLADAGLDPETLESRIRKRMEEKDAR